jgi:hypothetical protein
LLSSRKSFGSNLNPGGRPEYKVHFILIIIKTTITITTTTTTTVVEK